MSKFMFDSFTLILFLFITLAGNTQNWTSAGTGLSNYPNFFYVDSISNSLYAFGPFSVAGGHLVKGAAQYKGTDWDSIKIANHTTMLGGSIFRYGNRLIFSDTARVYSWNGVQVDTIATTISTIGGVYGFTTFNNDLIAWGNFDSINGVAANFIAKWDGTSWSAIDTTHWSDPIVVAKEYKGELYIGGNMYNYGGVSRDLSRWNGTNWLPVGNGIQGGAASVSSFEIYHGDLYIGGVFNTSQGNPGNAIARWDGIQWKDVGTGMTNLNAGVRDLQVYNNELYASGSFNDMGGVTIQGISEWNGLRWCGVGFDSYTVNAMAVYNNELYVGGPFTAINGIPLNHIAKWIGGNYTDTCSVATGVNELSNEGFSFTIYPNPATNHLTLTTTTALHNPAVTITTSTGSVVMQTTFTNPNKNEIDISTLPAGLYFLSLYIEGERVVRRFVKE